MKRDKALRGLSQDHHLGLVAARRLRLAGEGKYPAVETVQGLLEIWTELLEPHFELEENGLPHPAPLEAMRRRMLSEHKALREGVRTLAQGKAGAEALGALGKALHDHIRFEEREYFPALEKALGPEGLVELGRTLGASAPRCPAPELLMFLRG